MTTFNRIFLVAIAFFITVINNLPTRISSYHFQDIYWFWIGEIILLAAFSILLLVQSQKDSPKCLVVSLFDKIILSALALVMAVSSKFSTPLLNWESLRWLCSIIVLLKIFHLLCLVGEEQKQWVKEIFVISILLAHIPIVVWRIILWCKFLPNTQFISFTEFILPFPNTGVWGNYLATILPFAVAVMLLPKEQLDSRWYRLMRTAALLCAPLFAGLLVMTQARAGWMAATVGVVIVLAFHFLQKQKLSLSTILTRLSFLQKALIGLGSVVVVIGTSYGVYFLKPASAFGRILIQKVSLNVFFDHFWTGVGLGRFGSMYGAYQAQYFKNHPTDTQAAWLADDLTYAYNEFIHIGAELGIIGLLCVFCLAVVTVRRFLQLQRTSSSNEERYLRQGAFASLVSFWITGLFSYPMHTLQILLLVAFFFSLLTVPNRERDTIIHLRTTVVRGVAVIGIMICSLGGYRLYQEYQACVEWRSLADDAKMDVFSYQKYNALYPLLCHHQAFLYNFGSELYYHGHYAEALYYLQQARQYISSSDIFILLGQTSEKLNHYQQAQEYYTTATFAKPNRIAPHYLLAKLYYENGKMTEAKYTAEKVCAMKMKVESGLGYQMKAEMRDILKTLK